MVPWNFFNQENSIFRTHDLGYIPYTHQKGCMFALVWEMSRTSSSPLGSFLEGYGRGGGA